MFVSDFTGDAISDIVTRQPDGEFWLYPWTGSTWGTITRMGDGSTIFKRSISDDINVNINIPREFSLEQNYPNPFNSITKINYKIPKASNVEITIYNMQGKKVTTLVNDYIEKGYHSVYWDASNFSSGVYFYRMRANFYDKTKKLLFLK